MAKIPQKLRDIIAKNIGSCREKKYPGHGGKKRCAEEFGVSPQQWSPWERGSRTPDEVRLQKIADFFGTTIESLCREPKPSRDSASPHSHHDRQNGQIRPVVAGAPTRQLIEETHLAAAYHQALSRLLNQANKADIRTTVNFMKSLADFLEAVS